ncbi:MAG TPA: GntR family transcriptional regulator [Solirubrobacterales bacterium]
MSVENTKLVDVYRVLREGIATGAYRPSEPLRAAKVADELGISRTPVREAFMRLASEGLVQYSPRHGARVIDLKAEELEEIFEMRAALEQIAIRHACAEAKPEDIAKLRKLCVSCHEVSEGDGDVDDLIAANSDLHDAINEISGRPQTIELISLLRDRARPYRVIALYDDEERRDSLREHDRLVELIEAGDAETATELLQEHFVRPMTRMKRYLGRGAARPGGLGS